MLLPVPVPDPRRKFLPISDPTRGYTRTRSLPVRFVDYRTVSVKPMARVVRRESPILMYSDFVNHSEGSAREVGTKPLERDT